MRKRLTSCLLSLVLICSLLPANVLAEELRDEPIPTAEEVLPETEEPKAPMETEESEAPAEPETPLSASAVQDSGEGTLAEEEPDPEVFAAEIVREGEETQQFQTLREAVMAAQTGDMIRLLDDCEETVQISMNSKKNTASVMGGAIHIQGQSILNIGDAMLADNEAAWGGAISAYASEVNIHGTLEGNTAARLGGGCYNSASMLNLNGAVICNNCAGTAGDDIFNADAAAKLSLGGTGKQTLDDCGDQIDGWYEDGMPGTAENDDGTTSTVYGPRWDAHSEQNHVKACHAGTVEGALAVKAAHKVIVPMEPDEPDAPFHSKSKAATNLNSRYQSDVTLSLPAQQETLISDVVFVLDKSTSPEKESALRMLETLREQVGADAKVRAGVVTFNTTAAKNGFFDLSTELDKIQMAFDAPQVSGTNLYAGILAGAAMLDADRMSIRPLVTWPDCDEDAWYYADMMEATNSHDYQWITVGGEKTEKWTEKLPQRDWAALEHTWSTANSAKGGEVVG